MNNLSEFKSIIVPLFFVSQGGFKDKNSFNFKNSTKKECELFFKCWSHSLSWSKVLLKEYFGMSDDNIIKARLAEKTFSYIAIEAIKHWTNVWMNMIIIYLEYYKQLKKVN